MNGKGSSPRNLGSKFHENYSKIKWSGVGEAPKVGRAVKIFKSSGKRVFSVSDKN
jgi:hypothetical protein